jgi:recombinational DNA repair protein (RecF pathway)
MLLTLEEALPPTANPTQDVRALTALLQPLMFKGWQTQPTTRKAVERETRKYLRKYVTQHGLTLQQLDQLHQKIMEKVKTYG